MESNFPNRKKLRITHYDYNTPGAYFITFCTYNRKHFLSQIVGAIYESPEPQLTVCGRLVESAIRSVPPHLGVIIDRYVIMPNHVHLIAIISGEDGTGSVRDASAQARSAISKMVGYIKMNASKGIRQHYGDIAVWQRGYHDHVIRNREDYLALATYIQENPIRWKLDKLYKEGKEHD